MNKIAVYSSHAFEKPYLTEAATSKFELIFIDEALTEKSVSLCKNCIGIAVFTSDEVSNDLLVQLRDNGVKFIVTRSTGYDHIDIKKAAMLRLPVANVPAYSPNAIAEHAVALMLALNRHLILSSQQVNQFDFRIEELTGFNLQDATIGIVGTGNIGAAVCKILQGFGSVILAYDIEENDALRDSGVRYVSFETLCRQSDIISLHVPLTKETTYLINCRSISKMKKNVMLINTSRGKLVNTADVIEAIDSGHIGYFGTDVYEKEKGIFFNDFSQVAFEDALLKSLIGMKNVIVTAHHAFLTKQALESIARITVSNIVNFINKEKCPNQVNEFETI